MANTRQLPKRHRSLLDQASVEADLRYGAQERSLLDTLGQRTRDYGRETAAHEGATRSLMTSLRGMADPAKFYEGVGLSGSLLQSLAGTPSGGRLAGELAGHQAESQRMRVGAEQGAMFLRQRLGEDFQNDLGRIRSANEGLLRERGLFEQSQLSGLIGDDRARRSKINADARQQAWQAEQKALDRELSRGNAWIRGGIDPSTGQRLPGAAKPGKPNQGRGWAPQGAQTTAYNTVQEALKWAKHFKKSGVSRADAAQALLMGAEEQTADVIDPTTGRPAVWQAGEIDPATDQPVDPRKVDTPKKRVVQDGLPKIASQLYLAAALDAAYDGFLSRRTQQLLHQNRIKIGPLGLRTYGQQRSQGRRVASRPGNAPGGADGRGQQRPT